MLPSKEEAERILMEAEQCNPGAWANHSRVAAKCAYRIAKRCRGLNPEKAYICGLLHDIGRRFGICQMRHIYAGYRYMIDMGYDEVARICLSHSFHLKRINEYVGDVDIEPQQVAELAQALTDMNFDDYDRLIQLCDSLAMAEGVVDMEERMLDVKRRYGSYPQDKWDANFRLRSYFEEKMGRDLYAVVRGA